MESGPEAEESARAWERCEKNPGHEYFISASDFRDTYLPTVHTDKHRDVLRAWIDLTVRLRVNWTSPDRPDDQAFSGLRGMKSLRVGTVWDVSDPVTDKPCPGDKCDEKIVRKSWIFRVRTAQHVVYNTEEAKATKVDLFYDDENCQKDGRLKTASAVKVVQFDPNRDASG